MAIGRLSILTAGRARFSRRQAGLADVLALFPITQLTRSTSYFRARRARRPSFLILAAISQVFTIDYVAKILGENMEWLWKLQTDMEPEDGFRWVYGVSEGGVPAFTELVIECLEKIIADERTTGRAPPISIGCSRFFSASGNAGVTHVTLWNSKTDGLLQRSYGSQGSQCDTESGGNSCAAETITPSQPND